MSSDDDPTLLIVEDNVRFADTLAPELKHRGYAVEIVDTGSGFARRDMIPLCPRCRQQMQQHPARTATVTVYLGFGRSGYLVPDAGDH